MPQYDGETKPFCLTTYGAVLYKLYFSTLKIIFLFTQIQTEIYTH